MASPVSVLILAAGLGTRMKSKKAKVLHRAGGRTLLGHVLTTCAKIASPARTVAVVGHQADEVRDSVSEFGIGFAVQADQRGTGHAVMAAREALQPDGLLVVLYGDGPLLSEGTLRRLIEKHSGSGAAATLITTTLADPTGYGRVIADADGRIQAVVEQKAATAEQLAISVVNSGIYCFRSELLWKHIDEIGTNNPAGEYYLTDIVEILRRAGHPIETLHVEDSDELLGINSRSELARADRVFRERKVQELMLAGVTVEQPGTVIVDPDVRVGRDSVIGPFVQLLGSTEIGEDCSVGACSVVRDTKLADGAVIGEFTVVNDSVLESGAKLGPFSRLRYGNHLEAGAAVGNFVELKNARVGRGSKAQHLAYLGDSTIGPGVNIGAGTITCNYDGVSKHKTTIGAGSFVGSNSTLIAPVEIGEGVYIAAGSVITNTVPSDALAIGRSRQVNKEEWAKLWRERFKKPV